MAIGKEHRKPNPKRLYCPYCGMLLASVLRYKYMSIDCNVCKARVTVRQDELGNGAVVSEFVIMEQGGSRQ